PAHVKSAIRRCLEIDPGRRFASVSELRTALTGPVRPARALTVPLLITFAIVLAAVTPLWKAFPFRPAQERRPDNQTGISARTATRRVAILDFENLTGDKSLDPFSVGISETLRTELARIQGFQLMDAGRRIGADALVAGSFQKLGTKVRLTARVFDAETG